jgi:hypothetical protein
MSDQQVPGVYEREPGFVGTAAALVRSAQREIPVPQFDNSELDEFDDQLKVLARLSARVREFNDAVDALSNEVSLDLYEIGADLPRPLNIEAVISEDVDVVGNEEPVSDQEAGGESHEADREHQEAAEKVGSMILGETVGQTEVVEDSESLSSGAQFLLDAIKKAGTEGVMKKDDFMASGYKGLELRSSQGAYDQAFYKDIKELVEKGLVSRSRGEYRLPEESTFLEK